jgi:hypothetical protein
MGTLGTIAKVSKSVAKNALENLVYRPGKVVAGAARDLRKLPKIAIAATKAAWSKLVGVVK